ncbi:DUF2509 family protein [Pectobacteriaceae bacterium CE90]|nr:DUF2509 family protein [Pectobacteriaceae bacterium CE90]
MKKDSQVGSSSLLMVMLLLMIGLLLLGGLQRQLDAAVQIGSDEQQYWRAFNRALSSLSWGLSLEWQGDQSDWQCQRLSAEILRVCLRLSPENGRGILRGEGAFSSQTTPLLLYHRVESLASATGLVLRPLAQGWFDSCPESQESQCASE